ncbi:MAG: hypothetical protein JNL94_14725 [Planctomycetes bacterium]|nr:hypothetical protein [Planctomycetota bacterium]
MSLVTASLCVALLVAQDPVPTLTSRFDASVRDAFANALRAPTTGSPLADARLESSTREPGGRQRVVYLLDESEMEPVTDSTPPAPLRASALESWLIDRITRSAPRLDYVRIQHAEQTQLTPSGSTRKCKTWLEFAGLEADVEQACDLMSKLVTANRKHVFIEGMFLFADATNRPTDPGVSVRTLTASEAAEMRGQMLKLKDVDVLAQPSIITSGGQRATISTINQVSYVADFEINVNGDRPIVDPEIRVVQEGLLLDLCPIIDADGETIRLIPRLEVDTLQRPIREFETEIGGVAELTIQVPFVEKVRWEPEPLELRSPQNAVMVSGLRVSRYDAESEDGDRDEVSMSLILTLTVTDPATDVSSGNDGIVGWFDAPQNLAAATLTRPALKDLRMDDPIEIRTATGTVKGTLIGWLNDTMFIRPEGPVTVGDRIHFVHRDVFEPN